MNRLATFLVKLFCWVRPLILLLVVGQQAAAQLNFDRPQYGMTNVNVKVGGYATINGGYGLSLSIGTWTAFRHLQPSFNLAINLVGGSNNLGNRNRYLTKSQVNAVLTPMLTVGTKTGLYQEISSFYFGSQAAVYANYRHSLTLGTNFVVMPRGLGRNVTTYRNRTQQVAYLGIRAGGSDWDVNLNVYDDYLLTDNSAFQGIADNFDRFYTGGGNLQIRTRNIILKQYADIYTGNFVRDLFDAPDLYQPYRYDSDSLKLTDIYIGQKHRKRHPRYVAQEPGQKLFNVGRSFTVLELAPGAFGRNTVAVNPTLQVFVGYQGGHPQMYAQNLIHTASKIDKVNPRYPTDSLYTSKTGLKNVRERLHFFYPAYDKGRPFGGISLIANTIPRAPNGK
jgi:hypothetical protein